jgi:hypothetical protein
MSKLITEPSICIPRTLDNRTWREIKDTFEHILGKGTVERVDIVRRRNDDSAFCRIFVHMRYWRVDDVTVAEMRNRLIAAETVKVVYDDPWFWKCSASRVPKPENTRKKTAPYMEFDGVCNSVLHTETPDQYRHRKAGDTEKEYLERKAPQDVSKTETQTSHVD